MKVGRDSEIEKLKEEIRQVELQIARLEKAKKGKGSRAHRRKLSAAKDGLEKLHKKHNEYVAKELSVPVPAEVAVKPIALIKSPVHQAPLRHEKRPSPLQHGRPLMDQIYLFLSHFATRTQKRAIREKLAYAGVSQEAEIWLGQVLLLGKLMGIAGFLAAWVIFREQFVLTLFAYAILAFLLVIFSAYVHLNVQIEDRKRRLEAVLPDAMQVIAANIRAGMTPVVALRAAARPEFGPIQEDIKFATTKSLGTDSFTGALSEMAAKTNSELFSRVLALFTASLKSGGHLAKLLENTAEDIRQTQELNRELATNTRLYAIFILFTVVIGTPLLLAVSIQFSTMVTGLQERTTTGGIASEISSIPLISVPMSVEFLFNSAIIILLITSLLASALLGVINQGSYSTGLKYSPFIAGAAILVFFLIKDFGLKAIMPAS